MSTEPSSKRGRWMLIALFAIFAGPILLAYGLNVFAPQWRPFGEINSGELLRPPKQISSQEINWLGLDDTGQIPGLRDVWTMAYVTGEECSSACQLVLLELRQLKIALGRNSQRLQELLVLTAPEPAALQAPKSLSGSLPIGSASKTLIPGSDEGADFLVLVDPQGYAVVRYPPDTPIKAMLEDLKRLLKISKIG